MLFLFILGPIMLAILASVALFGDQILNIAFFGPSSAMNPFISALGVIWLLLSTGMMTMLFPAIIDGFSVIEATKKSIRMSIQYFDRVFGVWISYVIVLMALVSPLLIMAIPSLWTGFNAIMIVMAIYAVIMGFFVALVFLPGMSIGLTRVYMILTADDIDLTPDEDEGGPSFIGGL